METILGLIMIYSWVHSVVIVIQKTKHTTQYEKVVLIVSLVSFMLYVLGTI